MTNDTKAPERIVTSKCGKTIIREGMKRFDDDIEWMPCDLHLALVAVAYEKVIDLCENAAPAPEWGSDTKSTYRFAGKDLARSIRKAIPTDAQAALEARDKQIREEALREAVDVAHDAVLDHGDDQVQVRFAVLALIEKDKTNE